MTTDRITNEQLAKLARSDITRAADRLAGLCDLKHADGLHRQLLKSGRTVDLLTLATLALHHLLNALEAAEDTDDETDVSYPGGPDDGA